MVKFNTANLRKAVSLSRINDYADKIEVVDVTNGGDTYYEGVVTLNVGTEDALELRDIIQFNGLLRDVWQEAFIQIGIQDKKATLFIYETREL